MIQIDEKFKDAAPEETVERIQRILSDNGFSVTEKYTESGLESCHAFRLTLDGSNAGCNGKGVTRALARASAYAELMERLQSNHIWGFGDINTEFGDAKYFDTEELIKHCKKTFETIAKSHPKANGNIASVEELAELSLLLNGGDKTKVIPYLNAVTKETEYLPIGFSKIYSTNGLAAGNTPEEAFVQGISEIIERYCQLKVMKDKATIPTIPEEYLKQFADTYKTIEEIRSAGYDVIVKDCSFDSPFPVLATILIDKSKHSYHVHLGCHPVFEIALRRTLTETFQGRTLKNVASIDTLISSDEYKATNAEILQNMVRSSGAYPLEFFKESEKEFIPHKNRLGMSNKELLREMLNYFRDNGYDVLVRDHSCLGFHTFRAIIPGYSEAFPFLLDYGINEQNMLALYRMAPGDYYNLSKDKATLCIAVEGQRLLHSVNTSFTSAFKCPVNIDSKENFALYYLNMAYLSWAAENKANAKAFLAKARQVAPSYDYDFLHCLEKCLKLRPKYSSGEETFKMLSPFYTEQTLTEVTTALKSGNPFKKYAHNCKDTDCEECKYKSVCTKAGKDIERGTVNKAIAAFDDAAAFERLKNLFSEAL